MKKSTAQTVGIGIIVTAFGYAMKARPGPEECRKTCGKEKPITWHKADSRQEREESFLYKYYIIYCKKLIYIINEKILNKYIYLCVYVYI